ncbi:protein-lysine N-methyltransferase [Aspergillus fischeri NRRL 181]|uniref:Methyltransferase n=1 Tax=Neosartorya fischeri (strain ATCC 1020 / DSM 3700 / CBS 544.65 / FGSC A1164 / JCM 1740 / NRRL 181 / WB 181) TaxID=331117 RepID=A1D992_NEOFI|nr:conserved hypothetical protein [Aspergillus fischeri NRRL 181]EAW20953.1 conserved hypothetical protein [Aspergillus fischeri NRRL 181]KAG2006631.1 hypothetical protein GB937_008509 [Aspergillus fischeri]
MSLVSSSVIDDDGDGQNDNCVSFDKLVAQYFQQVEPHLLEFPDGRTMIKSAAQSALYERMFNEAALWPIPPLNYRARVLKNILSLLEESISDPEEDEISDDLMECWSTLVTQPKPSALQQAQQLAYVKYTAPVQDADADGAPSGEHRANRTIITSESRGLILSAGTTGFRTWEAALHLGSFLSTPAGQVLVRGNRVIELGAGTGFLSMFCAKHLGVQSMVATDREPGLIENIRDCMRRNELDPAIFHPAIWEWGTPLSLTQSGQEDEGDAAVLGSGDLAFDVALGADLIYDVDLVPLLLSTLRDLFENYHLREFIISATLRNQDTFQTFLNACQMNDFQVECMPYQSPSAEMQTGFFHSTSIPIRTYRISRHGV